ncbi:MinD/ParA family ATP-binding protein [Nocardia bovistercoris]|uniref:AAA family ATPase n=1 Tax=Nocardia bovistercoris TaxID=2785916 RepID=A0A931N250_9NOCA|nr:AAA family ATPase [Nocardia bovistercoris]
MDTAEVEAESAATSATKDDPTSSKSAEQPDPTVTEARESESVPASPDGPYAGYSSAPGDSGPYKQVKPPGYEQQAPQPGYGPVEGFAPQTEQHQFAPPYTTGQFPPPYQGGPYPQGPHPHSAEPLPPPPHYGEPRPDGPGPQETQSAPIYSWAPPPPQHQPPMYPPQGGQGPGQGWSSGPAGAPQPQVPFQPQHVAQPGQSGHSVNDLNLLKRARRAPRSGWRRAVHKASGGMINPGESAADIVFRDLVDRVNQPVRGDYRIAILSLKGGVGKTTTTVGLGSTFASLRGDRVIAIDANPDLGTLAHRVPRQTRSTVRNLLEDQQISRYSDVRAHTSQAPSRLEVLASEQDPAVSEAFSEADYRKAIGILQSFYNIILTDCGTGLMHSAMSGVLDMASSLVLVTSPAIDGARSASATLDWLDHHGYGKLVERTVVVVNASRRGASTVDLDQLRKLFLDRTRAVQVVPFDDHLAEGAEIDLELVSKPTSRALLELAAMVADDFGYIAAQQYRNPGPPGVH